MVDQVALRVAQLKDQQSTLMLRPGAVVVARVLERHVGKGALSLAGMTLPAELPDNVQVGDRLRLRVQESGPERIVLQILTDSPVPAVALPLPGGLRLLVADEDPQAQASRAGAGQSLTLVFEAPRLGSLGIHLEVHEGRAQAVIRARVGESHALASASAPALEAALSDVTGRPALVKVEPRRDPVDLYA